MKTQHRLVLTSIGPSTNSNSALRSLLLAGCVLGTVNTSFAQTWTGGTGTDWNTSTNWSTNAVPVATGDVVFDGTGANLNIALSAPGPLKSLTFTAGQTAAVNINTIAGSSTPLVAAANLSFGATATSLTVGAGSGNHKIIGTGISGGGTFRDVAFAGSVTSFTFDIGSGAGFEINGRVGGGSLNAIYAKNGTGTLILSGPNGGGSAWQFTGASGMFNVNQGTVRFANAGASGNSGNKYTVVSGAAIELSGGFAQALNSGTITLNGTGTGTDGALRSLSGNNSLTVTTGGGGVVLASHSGIGVDVDTFTINPVVSGAFNLTKVGAGTLVLAGTNTLSGSTTVSAGTLSLTNNLALQNSALVTTGAGTVTLGVTTPTFGGLSGATGDLATVISSGYTAVTALTLNPGTGSSVTYGGAIADGVAGMTLTKSGAGTQILTGTNTHTGATTITAGTLSVGTAANLGAAASNLVFDGGTLQITGTALGNFSGIGHTVTFNAAKNVGLDINDSGHTFTVDQVLNQTTGTFTKLGAGTAILNQVNTYTGTTDIGGGTLVIADVNAVQTSNLVRISTTAGSGTLRLSTDTPVTAFPISGSSNNPGTVASDRATPGAGITHGFTTAGLGANTYNFISGPNVTGGTAGISINSVSMTSGAAGTTVLNPTTATLTIAGGITSQTNDRLRTLELGGTGTGHSINGVITQTVASALSLTKSNTSTWTLSGTSTYSGATTLSGGTLSLGHATNTLPDTTPVSLGSATLSIGAGFADTLGTLDVTGTATINLGSGSSTLAFANSSAVGGGTWAGTLSITGIFVPGASIKFGVGGLTGSQLAKISATGWTGFALDGSGFLTATAAGAGFPSWITGTFANGTVPSGKQGPNDDPDNDGISNLVEYAVAGQDPTVSNPTIGSFTSNTLSFTKRADASGLTYAIQESSDLGNLDDWTEVSGGSYVNNATTISYTPAPPSPVKNFIRLKVTGP